MGWQDAPEVGAQPKWAGAPTVAKRVVVDGKEMWEIGADAEEPAAGPKTPDRSGVAGTLDATVRGFSDMATFGLSDKIVAGLNSVVPVDKLTNPGIKSVWETGDIGSAFRNNLGQEQAVAAQDQKQHGFARGAGQVVGGIVGPVPGRGLIAKAATRAGKLAIPARVVAEGAAQGAMYGAGSGDTTDLVARVKNAGTEARNGATGALVGAGLVRGAGRLVSPVIDPAVAKLAKMGVTMTPGQRAGPGVRRWAENVAESIPGLGVPIRAAKRRGIEQFNRGAINEALKPIGAVLPTKVQAGRAAIDAAQEVIGNNYDQALAQINAPIDNVFQQGIAATAQRAATLPPAEAQLFDFVMKNKIAPLLQGKQALDGATLQNVHRTLQKLAADADKTPVAGEFLGDELRAVRQQFLDLAGRHSPEGADAFMRANAAEANMSRIYDAASKAHGDGVFTPQQLSAATAKKGYGNTTKKAAAGKGRMQDVADAGKSVLPNTVPNSGTAERGAFMGVLGGLGTGGITVNPAIAGLAAPALPYVPGVDALLQKFALRGQGQSAKALADYIRKRGYIGGKVGAPIALAIGD